MSEVKIPEGYRKTEAGLIPSDWKLLTIGDITSFSGGSQPPRSTFIFSPRPSYIRLIQIRDYKTSNFETYIPEHLANKKCEKTDIMIGRYGPPIFQILRGIEGAYNVALIKATPSNDIQREYLYYFLKTEKLFQLMELLSRRSSGQTGVELPALKAYPIPLPPKSEQTAIATALSDVDNLIQSLEKLIAKKEAVKTGTMQQLLTGKTRLPEFATREDGSVKGFKQTELGRIPEDWEVVRIIDNHIIATGNTPPTNDQRNYKGKFLFVSPADLGTNKLIHNTQKKLSLKGFKLARKFPKGSTLFTCIGSTIGKTGLATCELTSNQQINAVFPNEIDDFEFTYYALTHHSKRIKNKASEQAVPLINKTEFGQFEYMQPNELKEQTAIATILSDMDAEIHALQQRLEKTRDIKQGMMQQLLTGKVRLAH